MIEKNNDLKFRTIFIIFSFVFLELSRKSKSYLCHFPSTRVPSNNVTKILKNNTGAVNIRNDSNTDIRRFMKKQKYNLKTI